ncbi:efflux transporter outer membrane subunit [Novosphingobium decolorationis]|uniref:Efflux transporter outer membrane subunit n=1 Tax=Novosphingobium decolorationis TaxID=2698673 RepID=A0ABX8E0Q5_9SPHN|nr:efflux transporter outer membrane subunit [Novosphingobium decolorationis]QVM82702.1 efflux transporter outer membrane subunit [Novosphingobium decolorationis]
MTHHSSRARTTASPLLLALTLGACTVGPDYAAPSLEAPADWHSWRSGDGTLHTTSTDGAALPADWWTLWGDPVLNDLEARALVANPDIASAALHFAAARVQRGGAKAAGLPQVNLSGSLTRQRLSENGASTRLFDVIGSEAERDQMARFLANPFTLFQGGFDAGWEPDLWGKVRRSLEVADARVEGQAATLEQARLTVASEVARSYVELRSVQRQLALAQEDRDILTEREEIVGARVRAGLDGHAVLEGETMARAGAQATLAPLRAQEAALINALAVLTGERPGGLQDLLDPPAGTGVPSDPDLGLGLPSEVALGRPDVRAAGAQLHAATAEIGVAVADLYPSIRLGGGFSLESYRSENLFDWGSRTWSVGPSLNLPLFDGGRRRRVVALRRIEQREAAVRFQQTVLSAWQEIDDALNGYGAERSRRDELAARLAGAERRRDLVQANYAAGNVSYLPLLDARRAVLGAQRELAQSEGNLRTRFIAVNKAVGNVPPGDPAGGEGAP